MASILCNAGISESAIVLFAAPGSTSGSVALNVIQNDGFDITLSLSTDCPYLTVPAGGYEAGSIASPNTYVFAYDTTGHSQSGVVLCGTITVSSNEEGCTETIDVPVYVWKVDDDDDYMEVCGAIMPSSIHVNVDDPDTHNQFFPIIRSQEPGDKGANTNLITNGCPYAQIDYEGAQGQNGGGDYQLNSIGEAVVYPIEFNVNDFEDCGENIHVCTFTVSQSYQLAGPPIECEQDINVYFTNECPQRSCPIGWNITSQQISKNSGDTGGFYATLLNSGSSAISVVLSTTCPYITLPAGPIALDGMDTENLQFLYDVSDHTACGTNLCGTVTAVVDYGESQSCEQTFDVYIDYECADENNDAYQTSLTDTSGNPSVEISSDCSVITIVDESVWSSPGHLYSDFKDFRKITIKHLQSGTEFVMSSLGDGDIDILPAETQTQETFTYNVPEGGVYVITLCNIPTHSLSYQYQGNDDVVWFNGKLYAAIDDSQGILPVGMPNSANNWIEITLDQISQYSLKYCAQQIVIATCDIAQCLATKYKDLACSMDCNELDLCKNKKFREIMKIDTLLIGLDEAIYENDMVNATFIYDKLKQICTC